MAFYERAIKYLVTGMTSRRTVFPNKVSKLNLTSARLFGKSCEAVKACDLEDIDMDEWYEEYGNVEAIINTPEMAESHGEERYQGRSVRLRSL